MTATQTAQMQNPVRNNGVIYEDVPCPLCGAEDEELLLCSGADEDGQAYRLVRCCSCGLGYLNPRPNEQSIGRFYPDEYEWYHPPIRRNSRWNGVRQYLRRLVMSRCYGNPPALTGWGERMLAAATTPWHQPTPESMTGLPYQGEGRLLDFGCGSGWYAHRMQQLGWAVTGMDFNKQAVVRAEKRFGIPMLVGTLPHPEVAPASFDVVTMNNVLEHVHRPHDVIASAGEALRPGGYVMVSLPNLASWGFRVFGENWWGLQLPQHLLYFTPDTLRRLLESHGLEVRQMNIIGQAGWMRRTLAACRHCKSPSPFASFGKLRGVSSALTRWSVWQGGGDLLQALAYRRE
jgi:2-polyprenyl-3-methyl-5-hydroxy-6-metoxy-1,4-benzoquinol methylase